MYVFYITLTIWVKVMLLSLVYLAGQKAQKLNDILVNIGTKENLKFISNDEINFRMLKQNFDMLNSKTPST